MVVIFILAVGKKKIRIKESVLVCEKPAGLEKTEIIA